MNLVSVLALSLFPPLLFVLYTLVLRKTSPKNGTRSSSALKLPGAWPILGHLPLFALQKVPTFRTLSAMADLHGPVFVVQLGMQPIVVVSSWELFKECLTTKDKALASRPLFAQGKYLGDDFASFGLAPLGPLWREMRRLTVVELLSSAKLEELGHIRVSELNDFLKSLHQSPDCQINLSEWFGVLVMNTVVRLMARKRYAYHGVQNEEARRVRRVVRELMYVFGQFVPSDAFPLSLVEKLDPQGHIRTMKRVSAEIDQLFGGWIDEHRRQGEQPEQKDFVDALIALAEEGKITKSDEYEADTIIKATMKSIFVGASDSTSLTLAWMTSLLLNHRHVMRLVVEEIDRVVGRDRWVEEGDIASLVYLQAVVKETLRLYPPGPLSTPHAAAEDCCVGGRQMKRGDQLLFNVWKVHRDPRVWSQPHEFIPERFCGESKVAFGVTKGPEFWYIPFGSGRRSCPGSQLAFQVLHLTMARLMQGFHMSTPMDEAVNMEEGQGISLLKKYPLQVIATPRLSSHMYAKL